MKNHADCKVTICGYADKQTGNADINERLSKIVQKLLQLC